MKHPRNLVPIQYSKCSGNFFLCHRHGVCDFVRDIDLREKLLWVDLAVSDVLIIDVNEECAGNTNTSFFDADALECNVDNVIFLHVGGTLHFVDVPCAIIVFHENIRATRNCARHERRLKQGSCTARNRLFCIHCRRHTETIDVHCSQKQFLCPTIDNISLIENSLKRRIGRGK